MKILRLRNRRKMALAHLGAQADLNIALPSTPTPYHRRNGLGRILLTWVGDFIQHG